MPFMANVEGRAGRREQVPTQVICEDCVDTLVYADESGNGYFVGPHNVKSLDFAGKTTSQQDRSVFREVRILCKQSKNN